jgi:hypothetical protein
MAKIFPFWRLVPPVPPPVTERILNGGFEYGDFTYWDLYGTPEIVTDPVHAGTYAAYLGYQQSIKQTLTAPVPQSSIASFSVWIYGEDFMWDHSSAKITIYYDDGSSSTHNFEAPNHSWLQIDLKPYVDSGKNVSAVRIRSWLDYAYKLWVDDVSLIA